MKKRNILLIVVFILLAINGIRISYSNLRSVYLITPQNKSNFYYTLAPSEDLSRDFFVYKGFDNIRICADHEHLSESLDVSLYKDGVEVYHSPNAEYDPPNDYVTIYLPERVPGGNYKLNIKNVGNIPVNLSLVNNHPHYTNSE